MGGSTMVAGYSVGYQAGEAGACEGWWKEGGATLDAGGACEPSCARPRVRAAAQAGRATTSCAANHRVRQCVRAGDAWWKMWLLCTVCAAGVQTAVLVQTQGADLVGRGQRDRAY